ncbi:hypothetical protein BO99DRAFT_435895 [Aspergillus violaceofuscus CBS 115571]|uniref:Uncharacterized protein n=1 Tax=Aspergillus violaceofuscus (strain CBS 115571) TaxID=1450538 RepID=A0A2V5H597_ASPV1|nr:hypothetical protein BO99DRAFT_435895 [Aspergillus violaceofuscus CBS 115571]
MTSSVSIRFQSLEAFEKNNDAVMKIIREIGGTDKFVATKSFPPAYSHWALSQEAIDKLKALDGVVVQVSAEDDEDLPV